MALPEPLPGLVIRYSYLWRSEWLLGREEGVKDRPCAIVLVTVDHEGDKIVTVLPITHAPPADISLAVEVPAAVKRRLGLDEQQSWVLLTEANRFVWPGPDLRVAKRGDSSSVAFGLLPDRLFEEIRVSFIKAIRERRAKPVTRSE